MSRFLLSAHEQGTPGWFKDRAGRATGSMADAVFAKGKDNTEAVTRRNYRYQLACERLTGRPAISDFANRHTDRGNEQEPYARAVYELALDLSVKRAGFAYWPGLAIGCSVDGFVTHSQRQGFIEIKCPLPAIHVEYLEKDRVPPIYKKQILHNMLVTGCEFCDFISYNDELPEPLQLCVVRVEQHELQAEIDEYEAALMQFLTDVDELTGHLRVMAAHRPRFLIDQFEVLE